MSVANDPHSTASNGRTQLRRLDPAAEAARAAKTTPSVLVVDDDELVVELVTAILRETGLDVVAAADGREALDRLAEATPDLILCDVVMPRMNGIELLRRLRTSPATNPIPVVMLTAKGATQEVVDALHAGADDYVRKPFVPEELVARVRAKLERRPVPASQLEHDPHTALRTERVLESELTIELARTQRSRRPGCVAVLELAELQRVRIRLGARAGDELLRQVSRDVTGWLDPLDTAASGQHGEVLLLLPEVTTGIAEKRLTELAELLSARTFRAAGERVRLTPAVGLAEFGTDRATTADTPELLRRARVASGDAAAHLDVRPRLWTPALERDHPARQTLRQRLQRLGVPFQIVLVQLLGLAIPFLLYWGLDQAGVDITHVAYWIVVVGLLMTAVAIWIEGIAALHAARTPAEPGAPYPPATAIIAAYLPNEADTVIETIEAFLAIEYPAPLQVILAYNTPRDHPLERTLHEYADRHPSFVPLRIMFSTSKAQNVNGALSEATGEFIGVFDADHKPAPDAFRRAWRWLSNGYDVVQGHCVVRNGHVNRLARTVAVEFESIYAVSHPGRARLHGFGIFGGSNGYWHADDLRRVRMRGSMLTEDIDSSMRLLEFGGRIASDPQLLSAELAPTQLKALWNQRMRWAQGWLQVSIRHSIRALRSPILGRRQKLGIVYLLGWREAYPWISLQMFPILGFWLWKYGPSSINWLVPLFVFTTLFTLGAGPAQTLFAYRLAAADIKRHRSWFPPYLLASTVFYTEFKNIIARVAHVKELLGERHWRITPRPSEPTEQPR